jgi:hypothetical protein
VVGGHGPADSVGDGLRGSQQPRGAFR